LRIVSSSAQDARFFKTVSMPVLMTFAPFTGDIDVMLLVHRDALDELLPPFPQIVRQVIGALVPGERYEEVQRDRHGLRISDLADVSPSACLPSWSLSPCALMSSKILLVVVPCTE